MIKKEKNSSVPRMAEGKRTAEDQKPIGMAAAKEKFLQMVELHNQMMELHNQLHTAYLQLKSELTEGK